MHYLKAVIKETLRLHPMLFVRESIQDMKIQVTLRLEQRFISMHGQLEENLCHGMNQRNLSQKGS